MVHLGADWLHVDVMVSRRAAGEALQERRGATAVCCWLHFSEGCDTSEQAPRLPRQSIDRNQPSLGCRTDTLCPT